jgi:hypothetical protein
VYLFLVFLFFFPSLYRRFARIPLTALVARWTAKHELPRAHFAHLNRASTVISRSVPSFITIISRRTFARVAGRSDAARAAVASADVDARVPSSSSSPRVRASPRVAFDAFARASRARCAQRMVLDHARRERARVASARA